MGLFNQYAWEEENGWNTNVPRSKINPKPYLFTKSFPADCGYRIAIGAVLTDGPTKFKVTAIYEVEVLNGILTIKGHGELVNTNT
jgi:hypothetical protein